MVLAASQYEKQQRERAHLESFIDRFRAKATKARQAQSRMKMLAKMEELAPLHVTAPFSFEFREPLRAPNPLLVLEDVDAGYPEKTVLEDISFSLQSDQRIGLLGVNGAGKSTLIKTIAGALAPLAGQGDLQQGAGDRLLRAAPGRDAARRPVAAVAPVDALVPGDVREQDLRNYLGGFNFPGDMATDSIEHFSGGEKARLALALIVWQRPNLLLLDEPTNHLDLETREALDGGAGAVRGHAGAGVARPAPAARDHRPVPHRRRRQAAPFDGDLDDYRDWLFKTKLAPEEQSAPLPEAKKPAPARPRTSARASAGKPRSARRASAARKPSSRASSGIDEQMAKLSAKKAAIDARLADPAIYGEGRKETLKTADPRPGLRRPRARAGSRPNGWSCSGRSRICTT